MILDELRGLYIGQEFGNGFWDSLQLKKVAETIVFECDMPTL